MLKATHDNYDRKKGLTKENKKIVYKQNYDGEKQQLKSLYTVSTP